MNMQDYTYVDVANKNYKMFYDIEEAKEDFASRYREHAYSDVFDSLDCKLLIATNEESVVYRIESKETCDYTTLSHGIENIKYCEIDSHLDDKPFLYFGN